MIDKTPTNDKQLPEAPCHRINLKFPEKSVAHGPHEWWTDINGVIYWCPGLKAHPLCMIGKGN